MKTLFVTAYQTTKKLLETKSDVDLIISRYMFEKFGTLPEAVTEMDDYQKGVVFAFLEDIVEVHNDQLKRQQREARRHNVRRR